MEPDYVLRMGEHVVSGRDDAYREATARQMAQFPGLGLTVHRIATSGERLFMHFSEHGASAAHEGRRCAWSGIGLYQWNGTRLTRNFVEQDYFSRRRQLADAVCNPVYHPAVAPWDSEPESPDAGAEKVAVAWLRSDRLATTPGVCCDDQWTGRDAAPLVSQTSIDINDLFSCGQTVAFHVRQHGGLMPAEDLKGEPGRTVFLDMAGFVDIRDREVSSGAIIRNRLDLSRRLRATAR